MNNCSRCQGQGYHHWFGGSFSVCEKCEGSGTPMGDAAPIVREMMHVIDDLRAKVNEHATEHAKQYRNGTHGTGIHQGGKPPASLRCKSCRGNGFNPDNQPNSLVIERCRRCNGTGTLGDAHPVIERLWYEIDRLRASANKRESEWAKKLRDAGGPSKFSALRPSISITDEDVWRHILGVAADTDAEAVKRAYKQKAGKHHPDHEGTGLDFRTVKLAYDNLMEGLERCGNTSTQ